MMVTLTRLLVMRIVANVRSESFLNSIIFLSRSVFSSASSSKSLGEREKMAISEPEANPDAISSNAANSPEIITPMVGAMKWTSPKTCSISIGNNSLSFFRTAACHFRPNRKPLKRKKRRRSSVCRPVPAPPRQKPKPISVSASPCSPPTLPLYYALFRACRHT